MQLTFQIDDRLNQENAHTVAEQMDLSLASGGGTYVNFIKSRAFPTGDKGTSGND